MTTDADTTARAEDLKVKGNDLLRGGDTEAAILSYTEAIELRPTHHVYYSNRSAAHLRVGSSAEALADAERCVKLAPQWAKGYNRAAGALLDLGRAADAIAMTTRGLDVEPGNAPLVATRERAQHRDYCDRIKGKWNGKVHEALGGYDQEFEFLTDSTVSIKVIGTSVQASYAVDPSHDPPHLNMTVPGPAPAVLHIFKLTESDGELHLCSPYMSPPDSHPADFSGPAYVVMRRGGVQQSEEDKAELAAVVAMSDEEKLQGFVREVAASIPENKKLLPEPGESDVECAMKMAENVRFQTAYHKVKTKYGEDTEQRARICIISEENGSVDTVTRALVDELRNKMRVAGLLASPEEQAAMMAQQQEQQKLQEQSTESIMSTEDIQASIQASLDTSSVPSPVAEAAAPAADVAASGSAAAPAATSAAAPAAAPAAASAPKAPERAAAKDAVDAPNSLLVPALVCLSVVCAAVAVAVWSFRGSGGESKSKSRVR